METIEQTYSTFFRMKTAPINAQTVNKRLQQLQVIIDTTATRLPLDSLLQAVLCNIQEMLQAENSALFLIDQSRLRLLAGSGLAELGLTHPHRPGQITLNGDTIVERVGAQRRLLMTHNAVETINAT